MKIRLFFILFLWVHGLAWAENISNSKKFDPPKPPNNYGEEDAWILDVHPPSDSANSPAPTLNPPATGDRNNTPAATFKKNRIPAALHATIKADQPWAAEYVERAVFTSGINHKEPVDILQDTPITLKKVYFFSELRNLDGKVATHRWYYNNQPVADMQFLIAGSRWRTWSFKELAQGPGLWKVQIIAEGKVIMEHQLPVTGAAAAITE